MIVLAIWDEFARITLINLGGIRDAKLPGSFVKISCARRMQILFFYPSIVGCSQEEENRQLGKLHSMPRRKK
jgi:hypothetical protein